MNVINKTSIKNYNIVIFIISALTLLNNLLNYYLIGNIYLYFIIFYIIILFSKYRSVYAADLILALYFISIILANAIVSIYSVKIYPLIYSLSYIVYPLFWILYFRTVQNKINVQIVIIYIYSAFLVSVLGIAQYFFSPDLFGLLVGSNSNNILWSSGLSLDEYANFFRATSIFGSPQVYGLFTSIAALLAFNYRNIIPTSITLTTMVGSLLSGNKICYLVAVYLVTRYLYRQSLSNLLLCFCVFLVILYIQPINITEFVAFNRVFQLDSIVEEERSGRLSIYSSLLEDFVSFTGIGAGQLADRNIASESYMLQILIENGVIPLLLFLSIIVLSVFNMIRLRRCQFSDCVVLIIFSFFPVHAFQDPVFFIAWAFLINVYTSTNYKFKERHEF